MYHHQQNSSHHHRAPTMWGLGLTLLIQTASLCVAGTTVVDSVNQQTPPYSYNDQQILIINSDEQGNTQSLSIGHPEGTTVIGYKPCTPDKPVAAMDCTGKVLRGVEWQGAMLAGGKFDEADLRNSVIKQAQLTNASFNNARLDQADLTDAKLVNCDFMNATLISAKLNGADLVNCDFMNADLRNAELKGARMVNTDFMEARLGGAIWQDGHRCQQGSVGACRR